MNKPDMVVIYRDLNGRLDQYSFSEDGDIFCGVNKKNYGKCVCVEALNYDNPQIGPMAQKAKRLGYDIKYIDLTA